MQVLTYLKTWIKLFPYVHQSLHNIWRNFLEVLHRIWYIWQVGESIVVCWKVAQYCSVHVLHASPSVIGPVLLQIWDRRLKSDLVSCMIMLRLLRMSKVCFMGSIFKKYVNTVFFHSASLFKSESSFFLIC